MLDERSIMARRPARDDDFDPDDSDQYEVDEADAVLGERDTAFCPECSAEIYDSADICPKCFAWLDGETSRHPLSKRRRRDWVQKAVAWALIAALLAGACAWIVLSVF